MRYHQWATHERNYNINKLNKSVLQKQNKNYIFEYMGFEIQFKLHLMAKIDRNKGTMDTFQEWETIIHFETDQIIAFSFTDQP